MAVSRTTGAEPPRSVGHPTLYRAVAGVYGPLLGVWFGVILMFAFSAGSTFATLRGEPGFEPVPGAPFESVFTEADTGTAQAAYGYATHLAGKVVWASSQWLVLIQAAVAVAVVVLCVIQCTVLRGALVRGVMGRVNLARLVLVALAVAGVGLMMFYILPGMEGARVGMNHIYYPGEEAMAAKAARDFQSLHLLSERVMGAVALLVAGAAVVSPFAFRVPSAGREGESAGQHVSMRESRDG